MRRAALLCLLASLVCGGLTEAPSADAGGASPHGTLTHTEYANLLSTLTAYRRWFTGHGSYFTTVDACSHDVGSTALVRSVGALCVNALDFAGVLYQLQADGPGCEKRAVTETTTGTTTAGTTTTGTGTTTTGTGTTTTGTGTTTTGTGTTTTDTYGFAPLGLAEAACLDFDFVSVELGAKAIYKSATIAHQRAVGRGFKGTCLATIAGTTTLLTDEKRLARVTKSLAADYVALTAIHNGTKPAHIPSVKSFGTNTIHWEFALSAWVKNAEPMNRLATCPHESPDRKG